MIFPIFDVISATIIVIGMPAVPIGHILHTLGNKVIGEYSLQAIPVRMPHSALRIQL